MKSSDRAVVLAGHGSRTRGFSAAMRRVARDLAADGGFGRIICAYLEIARPSIAEAIDRAVAAGAAEVRVLPYFVLSGRHVKEHFPAIAAAARKKHGRRARIILCPYLGYDKKVVSLTKERIRQGR